jgi:hypothetical protein
MTIGAPVLSFALLAMQGSPAPAGHVAGNVTDAASGAPISGARVTLMAVVDLPDGASLGSAPLQSTTNATGAFTFDGVPPGQFIVNVEKTGFASYSDPIAEAMRDRVTVDGKTAVAPLNVQLHRGAVLTGRILNAAGEPEADLDVSALRHTDKADFPEFLPTGHAQTNDLGEFRIAGLAAGEYLVLASTRPHGPFDPIPAGSATALAPTYFPGTLDQGTARIISLASGQEATGLEFSVKSVAAFRVSGVAVDSAGRPSAHAVVTLMTDWRTSGSFMPLMTIAGDDGTFVIANVIAGKYMIAADANAEAGGLGASGGFVVFTSETRDDVSGVGTEITVAADVKGLKVVAKGKSQ